jgi:hypothetical protein
LFPRAQLKPLFLQNIVLFEKIIFEQLTFKIFPWAIYFHPFFLWMKKRIQKKILKNYQFFCVVGLGNFAYEQNQNFVLNKKF